MWLSVIRSAQASCKDNNGFAVVHLTVAVKGNEPLLWKPAEVMKLHPASAKEAEMTPELVGVLMAFAGIS